MSYGQKLIADALVIRRTLQASNKLNEDDVKTIMSIISTGKLPTVRQTYHYLIYKGWVEQESTNKHTIRYFLPKMKITISMPKDESLSDYERCLSDMIGTIAFYQNDYILNVYNDMLNM